jgi:4-amino-4-deoxy-L-arabinose transferase-like glycosyltransferase
MEPSRKAQLSLALITLAVLAPFLNKQFNIDDPLFLWTAQQIAAHPLDPFGFSVNWTGVPEPMWHAMQNPPLCSCFIASVASVFGWSEVTLHAAFLLWAVAAVLGTFTLGQRFCRNLDFQYVRPAPKAFRAEESISSNPSLRRHDRPKVYVPFAAALLTLFAPAFFVSATSVMCDVMLLAFYVWSMELWIRGLDQKRWWLLALAMLFVSAAVLTKYFGITLLPLLAVYTLARDRRCWRQLLWFCFPIVAVAAYDFLSQAQYGHPLFVSAANYSREVAAKYKVPLPAQIFTGLAFVGGCIFSVAFFVPIRWRRLLIGAAILLFLALVAAFYFFVPRQSYYPVNKALICAEGAAFAAAGLGILALAPIDLWRKRDADSLHLCLWVIGTFLFSIFFNWSITARTILPMVPAVAILFARNFNWGRPSSAHWRLIAAAGISLLLAASDFREARVVRKVTEVFRERFAAELGTVWFQSHWGFQYYFQQWGARPLNLARPEIYSGDVMLIPANNTGVVPLSSDRIFPIEELTFPSFPLFTTHAADTGAGFYSSVHGPLPWAVDYVPPAKYYMARFR